MSLVNYGSSDEEDADIEQITRDDPPSSKEKISSESNETISANKNNNIITNPFSSTFKNLLKPNSSRIQIKAFDDDFLMKQNYHDSDHEEDDDEEYHKRKRLKRSEKGSTLISMLPKPKNSHKSIPSPIITNIDNGEKTNKPSTTRLLVPNSVLQRNNKIQASSSSTIEKSDDDDNLTNFFFNNDSSDDSENDDEIKTTPKPMYITEKYEQATTSTPPTAETIDQTGPVYGPSKPPENEKTDNHQLDVNNDVTLKKLIASKFDDNSDNIQIIDINVQKHLSENKEWLKNISLEKDEIDEKLEAKAPNSLAKRKNQITFLAYQAKKRELELKNQWAQNRQSKQQTRAKYGF